MEGYVEKKTINSGDRLYHDFLSRIMNTFLMGGSTVLYNKYSKIVFEGDNLNVFGVLSYNNISNVWEIINPLSFINGTKEEFISYL